MAWTDNLRAGARRHPVATFVTALWSAMTMCYFFAQSVLALAQSVDYVRSFDTQHPLAYRLLQNNIGVWLLIANLFVLLVFWRIIREPTESAESNDEPSDIGTKAPNEHFHRLLQHLPESHTNILRQISDHGSMEFDCDDALAILVEYAVIEAVYPTRRQGGRVTSAVFRLTAAAAPSVVHFFWSYRIGQTLAKATPNELDFLRLFCGPPTDRPRLKFEVYKAGEQLACNDVLVKVRHGVDLEIFHISETALALFQGNIFGLKIERSYVPVDPKNVDPPIELADPNIPPFERRY